MPNHDFPALSEKEGVCSACGIPGTVLEIAKNICVCAECLDYYCTRCDVCGEYYDTEVMTAHGGNWLCEPCAKAAGVFVAPEEEPEEYDDAVWQYEEE